jgi:methylthioribose-1-phosphate isomerase
MERHIPPQRTGAPAIGIAAAYGAYLGVKASEADNYAGLFEDFTG